MKLFLFFLLFCLSVNQSTCQKSSDICTKFGVMHLLDTFHISQKIEKELNIDILDYKDAFDQLNEKLPSFQAELEKYDTVQELKALEPLPLIPFSEQVNLVKTAVPFGESAENVCSKLNGSLIAIEPQQVKNLLEFMESNSIENLPVRVNTEANIQSITSKFLQSLTEAEINTYSSNAKSLITVLSKTDGKFKHITIPTAEYSILCSKINNPFDRPNAMQNLWLKTANKISASLPELRQWGSLVRKFLHTPARQSSTASQPPLDIQLPIPTSLSQVISFISKFSSEKPWTSLLPSDFPGFLQYCDNFKTLFGMFSKTSPKSELLPFSQWNSNKIPGLRYPGTLALNLETSVLLKYLNLDQHFRLSGPVLIQPLSTGPNAWNSGQDGTFIKVTATFRVYSAKEQAHLYQIKPVFYKNRITSMKYLITWGSQSITFTAQPALLQCSINREDILSTETKICHSFSQPGLPALDIERRISCAKILLSEQGNYDDCLPVTINDEAGKTIAVRGDCEGYPTPIVMISSTLRKIKVSIACSAAQKKAVEFTSFPAILETPCKLMLVTRDKEVALLPDNQPNHFNDQHRPLDFLINTPPSVAEPQPEVSVPEVETTTELSFKTFFFQPTYVSYFAVGVSIFTLTLIFFACLVLACKNLTIQEILVACCCCKPDSIASFLKKCACKLNCKCKHKNCCRKQTSQSTDQSSDSEVEEVTIRKPKKSSLKKKTNKTKINPLTDIELEELSKLMQARFEQRLPKQVNQQNNFPSAPPSMDASMASIPPMPSLPASTLPSPNLSMMNLSVKSIPNSSLKRPTKIVSHTFR